jgi:hypothetical protein
MSQIRTAAVVPTVPVLLDYNCHCHCLWRLMAGTGIHTFSPTASKDTEELSVKCSFFGAPPGCHPDSHFLVTAWEVIAVTNATSEMAAETATTVLEATTLTTTSPPGDNPPFSDSLDNPGPQMTLLCQMSPATSQLSHVGEAPFFFLFIKAASSHCHAVCRGKPSPFLCSPLGGTISSNKAPFRWFYFASW